MKPTCCVAYICDLNLPPISAFPNFTLDTPSSVIYNLYPGDLKTRKRTGTSCQIEIHFSIKTTKFLFKYTLLCSQIYDRFIIVFIKHNHKVSVSFIKGKQRYKWLKTAKWISILLLVPDLLLTGRSARCLACLATSRVHGSRYPARKTIWNSFNNWSLF